MSWETPKTDWDTDEGILDDDLNRMETNTLLLGEGRFVSGNVGYGAAAIGAGLLVDIQKIVMAIPDTHRVYIPRVSYFLPDTAASGELRLQLIGETGLGTTNGWTSAAAEGDHDYRDLSQYIHTNDTGGAVQSEIIIRLQNSGAVSRTPAKEAGWAIWLYAEAP